MRACDSASGSSVDDGTHQTFRRCSSQIGNLIVAGRNMRDSALAGSGPTEPQRLLSCEPEASRVEGKSRTHHSLLLEQSWGLISTHKDFQQRLDGPVAPRRCKLLQLRFSLGCIIPHLMDLYLVWAASFHLHVHSRARDGCSVLMFQPTPSIRFSARGCRDTRLAAPPEPNRH